MKKPFIIKSFICFQKEDLFRPITLCSLRFSDLLLILLRAQVNGVYCCFWRRGLARGSKYSFKAVESPSTCKPRVNNGGSAV